MEDYKEEGLDDQIRQILEGSQQPESEDEEDPVSHYMTRSEFLTLPIEERNQLALDRYWNKKKTSWELGRDYERFIGYRYETKDWNVQYHGIMEGFADLGRDLIASKGSETHIIQCKYWSQEKTIHEKHIFQLYGTVFAYRLDHPSKVVSGVFVTSTTLSDLARKFAIALGLEIQERVPFGRYPCIKCNVSHRDGGKIYHLPFDQQYDRTFIDPARGESYVMAVSEAQEAGFRRAYRWKGAGN